jgi:hypothetical protein
MDETQKNQLQKLTENTTRILFYLENDPSTGRIGLVEKVKIIEDLQNQMLLREKVFRAKAGVFGFLGGGILWIGKILITKIF